MINLELLLIRLVRLISTGLALRGHVKDLKHGVVVEMLEVKRFQYNLADNKIHELFLQLDLIEKVGQLVF